jgi:hypothetical protein
MHDDRSILPDLCGCDSHLEHDNTDRVWRGNDGLDMGLCSPSSAHGVHPAWGFLGIFLLLGPAVILWCKIQSANWEINKARREMRKQNGKSASFTSK